MTLQKSDKAYFAGALGVLSSRLVGIAAGVLSLWCLTRILSTEEFAGYSVAMSIVALLGFSVGLGIERSMLVKVAALAPGKRTLAGFRLMLKILMISAVLGGLAAILIVALSGGDTSPQHEFVRLLAPVVPATALSLVLIVWYQANHQVGVSEAMYGLNDGTRSLIFATCFILGLGASGVAAGAILGAVAPVFYLGIRAVGRTKAEPSGLGLSDVIGGLQFFVLRLAGMALRHLDIVALGAMGSFVGTAQYAVATRFADLVTSGQTIFAPTFMPRVRNHLSAGRHKMAAREYHVAQVLGFLCAYSLTLSFVLLGDPLLRVFGDFGTGFDVLMVLSAANLFTVGFGLHSAFLAMTEHLWRCTVNRVVSLVLFGLGLVILIPRFDALGAAAAFLIATVVHDVAGILILRRRLGISPFGVFDATIVAIACALFCLIGLGVVSKTAGFAAHFLILAATAWRHRAILIPVIGNLKSIVVPRA